MALNLRNKQMYFMVPSAGICLQTQTGTMQQILQENGADGTTQYAEKEQRSKQQRIIGSW